MKRWWIISLTIFMLVLGMQAVYSQAYAASFDVKMLRLVSGFIYHDTKRSNNSNQDGTANPSKGQSQGQRALNAVPLNSNNQPIFYIDYRSNISSSGETLLAVDLRTTGILLDKKTPHQVSLNLLGNSQFNLAEPIILTGLLKDMSTGLAIPNKTVTFTSNGIILGQTHTDAQGGFQVEIHKDLPAGSYVVTASFKGAHLLNPASNVISFKILPATVNVQTVPAVSGITFQMDGQQFVSGPDGMATVDINQAGVYRLSVLLDQYKNPSQQVEFGRWSIESYQPSRDVQVPSDSVIQVGLNIYHKVNLKFVDLDNYPVDLSRIGSISIRSVQGDVFDLKPGETPWLPASRTARRQNGLQETDLLYSINSVIIDGSNVVNSSQQRFYAKLDDTWSISLLLYTLNISVKDGLFAAPVGKSINLVYPDGQNVHFDLDNAGNAQIHTLARGIYHVSLIGVKGLGTSTPVALSRNQAVTMRIITPLDFAISGLTMMGISLGLIFYGRPWLLGYIFRIKHLSFRKSMDTHT